MIIYGREPCVSYICILLQAVLPNSDCESMKLMDLYLVLSVSEEDLTLKLDFLGRSPPFPPPPPDAEDEEEGRLVREVDVVVSPLVTFSDCVSR